MEFDVDFICESSFKKLVHHYGIFLHAQRDSDICSYCNTHQNLQKQIRGLHKLCTGDDLVAEPEEQKDEDDDMVINESLDHLLCSVYHDRRSYMYIRHDDV